MKTIWRQSKNCTTTLRLINIKNLVRIITSITFFFYMDVSQAKNVIDEKTAIIILKHSDFGNSITRLTRLFPVYHYKSEYLFHYVSNGWQADHTNEGLVVFINNQYHHDYYILQTCNFKVVGKRLICHFTDFPGEVETNLLSDVFTGKKIVIGGSEERPWRGSRTLYR